MKYAYFPGCVAKGACKELEKSVREICKVLGIGLTELTAASCCGAGVIGEVRPRLNMALNARTFAQAEKMGMDILTVCSTCRGVFEEVNEKLKDTKELEKANKNLEGIGYKYSGKVKIKHLLEVLIKDYGLDKLKLEVKKPLRQLKPAAMYGCHLLRPSKFLTFDNPNNPTSMEDLFKTLGAKPVFYEGRKKCCGFPILMMNKEASLKLAGKVLLEAKEKGANCIVAACPLCHMNFDSIQPEIEKVIKKELNLPVLHLSQFVGLALGLRYEQLGLNKNIVSTEELVRLVNI